MPIRDAYNQWARTYDSDENNTRNLDQVVTDRILGKSRFASIIEVGCGTGKNTLLFSRISTRVQAIDFSERMLQQAKTKLIHQDNVVFMRADLTEPWPCQTHSANLVSCNLVLEHIRDLRSVFAEAARVLMNDGQFFICELHPYRQYQGVVANYRSNGEVTPIPAFVHHISDFLEVARSCGFSFQALQEWWHEKDEGKPPRLVSFLFER